MKKEKMFKSKEIYNVILIIDNIVIKCVSFEQITLAFSEARVIAKKHGFIKENPFDGDNPFVFAKSSDYHQIVIVKSTLK